MTYDIHALTGSGYCYNYRELCSVASEEQVRGYCRAVKEQFRPIAKALDERSNALWLLRHYLAIKFATAAAIMSGSAEYARDHNLLLGVPYFNYYALLNCCRAFLLTSPDVEWSGHQTLRMSHSKIINLTSDLMKRLDRDRANQWREKLEAARGHRELYSYRFPASGRDAVGNTAFDPDDAGDLARLIAELAMLNSECFEASLAKHSPEIKHIPEMPDFEWADVYDVAGVLVVDKDDRYRFGKFLRFWGRVSTLEVMVSDGLMDDLFGNWCAKDSEEGLFDPDAYSDRILCL